MWRCFAPRKLSLTSTLIPFLPQSSPIAGIGWLCEPPAGIAKSWRTNRQAAYDAYLEDLADYAEAKTKATASGMPLDPKRIEPTWKEWNLPELRVPAIQANANVVAVEQSEDSTFDYWLRISTLDKGNPLHIPVKLAPYHKKALQGRTLNTSTTLHKRKGV